MKKFYILSLILLFTINYGYTSDSINISTPYHSIHNHLKYLQDETFHPELAAKSLDTKNLPDEEAENLAIKLKHIFDGRGHYIELEEVPREEKYIDTTTNKARFYPIQEDKDIYLIKTKDGWKYSAQTVKLIPKKHKELHPFGTELIVDLLPKKGHRKIMGLYLWQHLGVFVLILFAILTNWALPPLLRKFLFKILRKTADDSLDLKKYGPVAKMASLFVTTLLLSILFPVLQLPITISKNVVLLFKGLVPFFAMLIVYRLVDLLGIYMQKMAERTEGTLDDQLVPLVRKSLKIFVVVTGILFTLQNLNFNVTALLAGLSIGGVAIALAAQDTIKNLFGSLMIFLDKPFQAGDWITSGDIDGTVEEVGFRSTRVRTFGNSVIYIPNGKLADSTINNHGLRNFRRFKTTIGVTYDTPPKLIEIYVEGIRKIILDHPETNNKVVRIFLNDFDDSSLNILLDTFLAVPDYMSELRVRQELMVAIITLADKLGVRFAFPTQTLHIEEFPGKPSLTPEYDLEGKIIKKEKEENKAGTV
ncbi:mechanosensitive ion channel family protein [Cytophagaceae bacterium ABcell3]|nr:mechanosensitive ion channel family protein [Cytophagaceae bacterium ABcell3]